MSFADFLQNGERCLSHGSVYELLRRSSEVTFDPHIAHAGLIYHPPYAQVLARVMRSYIDVAVAAAMPIVVGTATWRASEERIRASAFADRAVNEDNVRFLGAIRDSYRASGIAIHIKGDVGPRGDAYKPEEALTTKAAKSFHAYQIEKLAASDIDFLQASTQPAVSEAAGLALAMAQTGLPYLISFVVDREGHLLDGTPLSDAIAHVDDAVGDGSARFSVNCVHPTILHQALDKNSAIADRILSFCGNTSDKSAKELDGATELLTQEPTSFAQANRELIAAHPIPIVGACCGSSPEHIRAIAAMLKAG